MVTEGSARRKAQAEINDAFSPLQSPYASETPTKPLRRRRRIPPQDFSPSLVDLSSLAEERGRLGRVRVEYYNGDYGGEAIVPGSPKGEPVIVVDPAGEDSKPASSLLGIHKALVELSERACPTDGLGDEALGLCYSPSAEAGWLVRDFVAKYGLLEYSRGAYCDCVGAQAKIGRRHEVTDRFLWLHIDFEAKNPDVTQVNAVAWILQEALALRRAFRIWDALRRYRLGAASKAVASLWRKNRDGRLWLFDAWHAPLKPPHRVLVDMAQAYLERLLNVHIWDVRAQVTHSYFPPGAGIRKTDLRRSKAKLGLSPRTPLAAAWLQLFDDILSDRASGRICQECRDVFDPTRTDQVFCSKRCSNRQHARLIRQRRATGPLRRTATAKSGSSTGAVRRRESGAIERSPP